MENKICSICYKEIYSEITKGCKLCGMPLEDKSKEFCSKNCRLKYRNIHKDEKNI